MLKLTGILNDLLGGNFAMATHYSKFSINIDLKMYFEIVQIIPSAN